MGMIRNVAIVALIAGAYASNPDEQSFQRYVEDEMKRYKGHRREGSTWLERKVVSHLTSKMYHRQNYYLFSLVRLPEDRLTFVGLFGQWFRMPTSLPSSSSSSSPPSSKQD